MLNTVPGMANYIFLDTNAATDAQETTFPKSPSGQVTLPTLILRLLRFLGTVWLMCLHLCSEGCWESESVPHFQLL